MLQRISIQPHQLQQYTKITVSSAGALNGFPLMSVDADSYIVGAEIQSGIDFDVEAGRHCIAIGKGCSLADSITFLLNLDHDHCSVSQGVWSFLQDTEKTHRNWQKGSIILQNEVWVGHGATILGGVTLHNGCVVAAGSVVTKDVPPYAIAGGNPARVFRYRFDESTVAALQEIAWWDWPPEVQRARKMDFALPVPAFIAKYLPHKDNNGGFTIARRTDRERPVVLFAADMGEPYPLYPEVLRQYFEIDRPRTELLIYLPEKLSTPQNIRTMEALLETYSHRDSFVTLQTGKTLDEQMLVQGADYFVTTRARQTVCRTCLADRYQVKVLYGTDCPIFPPELF